MPEQPPEGYPVTMVLDPLGSPPTYPMPEGYSVRTMTELDIGLWTDIQRDAEPYLDIDAGLFAREFEFNGDLDEAWKRCLLLQNPRGLAIGTISAWFDPDFRGRDYGRIHWVSIRPAYQGKGLAKPMTSAAMQLLAKWHDRVYLRTQSKRIPAINLYMKFGFTPLIENEEDQRVWDDIIAFIRH